MFVRISMPNENLEGKLAIGTRFFGRDAQKDIPRLDKIIDAASSLGVVFVAINSEEDKTNSLAYISEKYPDGSRSYAVDSFAVSPWGKFVPALDAITYKAARAGADYLLLASAEFPPTKPQVEHLTRYINGQTLVAGARFAEHTFRPGEIVEGTGTTVPWNTFALWNMHYLPRIGFVIAGDAPFDPAKAGVEEVTTIATFQTLYPNLDAYLVEVPGVGGGWNTEGWDAARLAQHQKKIASKNERPAEQLKWSELKAPRIKHVA